MHSGPAAMQAMLVTCATRYAAVRPGTSPTSTAADRFEVSVASAVKWLQRCVSAEERRPEAARRERFTVLEAVRGRDFGSDRPNGRT